MGLSLYITQKEMRYTRMMLYTKRLIRNRPIESSLNLKKLLELQQFS